MIKKTICLLLFTLSLKSFAQIFPYKDIESDMIKRHREEISQKCSILAEDAFNQLCIRYYVLQSYREDFRKLYYEREVRKASYDYMGLDAYQRTIYKMEIDSVYQNIIDTKIMPDNNFAGETLSLALRLKKSLKINDESYTNIVRDGLNILRQKRQFVKRDFDVLEMKSLKINLTQKQLTKLLNAKNASYVTDKTDNAWKILKAEGLTESLDSAKEYSLAYSYYMLEKNILDLYVGNEKLIRNNLNDLRSQKPKVVKLSESLKQKNINSINKNMLW